MSSVSKIISKKSLLDYYSGQKIIIKNLRKLKKIAGSIIGPAIAGPTGPFATALISCVTWMVVGASIRARDVETWMNVAKWGFPLGSFGDKTQGEELLGRNRRSIIRIPKQLVEIFREHSKTAISVIWLRSATGQMQPLRLLYTTLQLVRMLVQLCIDCN